MRAAFSPRSLPRDDRKPTSLRIAANFAPGTAPRRLELELDRDIELDVDGFRKCRIARLQAKSPAQARRSCRGAVVGHGTTRTEVTFPEQAPLVFGATTLLFNGGARRGATTLYLYSYSTHPNPTATVLAVTARRIRKGSYATRLRLPIPRIAGGFGSLRRLNLRTSRRLLSAACADRRLGLHATAFFAGGGSEGARVSAPCAARR